MEELVTLGDFGFLFPLQLHLVDPPLPRNVLVSRGSVCECAKGEILLEKAWSWGRGGGGDACCVPASEDKVCRYILQEQQC